MCARSYIVLAHAGTHGTLASSNRSMGPRVREDDVWVFLSASLLAAADSKI